MVITLWYLSHNAKARLDDKEALESKQEAIRKKAKQIDNYIFKWILIDGTEVTLFQCPKKWLRVSVKRLQGEFTVPLLEPQKTEDQTKAAIQKAISLYPHVDEKNTRYRVSFKDYFEQGSHQFKTKTKVIERWDLAYKYVREQPTFNDSFYDSFSIDHLDASELSLIEENGRLRWQFFAKKSRTFSVLEKAIKNTYFFEEGKYQIRSTSDLESFQKDLKHYEIGVVAESEPDYQHAISSGQYCELSKRATRIKGVYLTPYRYSSKLDPTQSISCNEWAVTLISMPPKPPYPPHAEILLEKITPNGHLFQLVHLGAPCDIYDAEQYCGKGGTPNLSKEMTFDKVLFDRRSPVWIRSAKKVQALIRLIQIQESQKVTVPFHLLGKDSLITKLFHKDTCHNCTTWTKEQLAALDIKLPDKITDLFVTHPNQYTNKTITTGGVL